MAFASGPVWSFQEQQVPSPVPNAPAAKVEPAPDASLAPSQGSKPASGGTEVRIPGLGKLGVLPKMDFGLELLYGANEPKPATQEDREVPEDLTIRGSIKQPF
jgi:hypothetical protein